MSEEKDLLRLENEWKHRFDRFTAPEPTREQTLSLLENIKRVELENKPVDVRHDLENIQSSQTLKQKLMNLLLSQWTFHGMKSWILTGVIMLILTVTISLNSEGTAGFVTWIRWMTLGMIGVIGYAFRSKDEGNDVIEKLSYYPLIYQMFARFVIVMSLQMLIALPLIFIILGKASTIEYIIGTFTPLFFFGVVGFVTIMWLGQKIGLFCTLTVWFSQLFLEKIFNSISLFKLYESDQTMILNASIWIVSLGLLMTILLSQRLIKEEK